MASDVSNLTPILRRGDNISPIKLFSQVDVNPKVKHVHTFGLPVHVLDTKLQAGQQEPKWEHKARIGVYLGASPRHSRKVALVLSLQTGLVSPQLHCQFNDMCNTLRPSAGNPLPQSIWQQKAGFSGPLMKEISVPRNPQETQRQSIESRWDVAATDEQDIDSFPRVYQQGLRPQHQQVSSEGESEDDGTSEVTKLIGPVVTRYGRVIRKPV